jgi:hypothetical protein
MHIDLLPQGDIGDADLIVEQGNAAIGICRSLLAQAEDVLGRGVGFGEREDTK